MTLLLKQRIRSLFVIFIFLLVVSITGAEGKDKSNAPARIESVAFADPAIAAHSFGYQPVYLYQEIPEISDPLYQVLPDLSFLPPFVQSVISFAWVALIHILVTFGFITALAFLLSAFSEAYWVGGLRTKLLDHPNEGGYTVWRAVLFGIASLPVRKRIFAQAKELLIRNVSKAGVLVYLFSAQSILLFMLLFITELNGPQPALGLLVAVAVGILLLSWLVRFLPDDQWKAIRKRAEVTFRENGEETLLFTGLSGSAWQRLRKSLSGLIRSLWAPILYGCLGIGLFLAWGYTDAAFSLQESRGVLSQVINTGAGLVFSFTLGAPLIGNAMFAAGMWKGLFITYSGLIAFYMGTMVMPFTIHRYFDLFGYESGRKIIKWLITAIVTGALATTAWWWGLDSLAELLGIRDWIESIIHSTLRPNDVPWFHRWFAPGL